MRNDMKKIVILGSTGSIGTQTLDVVRKYPDKTAVRYTTAYGDFRELLPPQQYRVRVSEKGILCQLPEEEEILFNSLK